LTDGTAVSPANFGNAKRAVIAAKIFVTLACFWYLFRHIEVAELRRTLPGFDVRWAVAAVLLLVLQIPLIALRWLRIVEVVKLRGDGLSYRWMTAVSAIGQFFGQVLPIVAGDGVRVWLLTDLVGDWRYAAISVAIDRCVGIALLFAFAFAILLFPSGLGLFEAYRVEVVVVLGVMLAIGAGGLVLGARVSRAIVERRGGKWIADFFAGAHRAAFGPHSAAILGAGCLIHALTIAAVWSLGRAQGLALSPADAAVLFAVMVGIALFPFAVGGWGLRELAMVSLFGNYGLTPERALVFSMYFGLACMIASLPGAVAWFGFMIPRPARSSSSGS